MNSPKWQQSMRLDGGEAVTLRTAHCGILRVTQGRIWATLGHSPVRGSTSSGAEPRGGDYFVTPQRDLCIAPGQCVVLESWPTLDGHSALLQWIPA